MDKIIIFGKNGMLGRYLCTYLKQCNYDIIAFDRKDYDVEKDNYENLYDLLEKYKIYEKVLIINAIGLIPQTNCKNESKYLLINSVFPHMLSSICKLFNWKFIHPTTDCVYTGMKGSSYDENDEFDEKHFYGLSKGCGEPNYGTIIRCSIIGEELNHKYSLIEWAKSNNGKTINGYINHFWNGITCLQYGKIIDTIIKKNMFWNECRHIYSPNVVSKFELVNMVNNYYYLNLNIIQYKTDITYDKTLTSIYPEINKTFNIPELDIQIKEMSEFNLI